MMTIWLSNLIAQKYVILNIQGFLCNWQGPGCNWQQDRKGRVCISPEKAWERPLPVDYDSWRWYGEVYLEVIFFSTVVYIRMLYQQTDMRSKNNWNYETIDHVYSLTNALGNNVLYAMKKIA